MNTMKRISVHRLTLSTALLTIVSGGALAQDQTSEEQAVNGLEQRLERASTALEQNSYQRAEQNLDEAGELLQSALEEAEGEEETFQLQRVAQELRQANNSLDDNDLDSTRDSVGEARRLIADVQAMESDDQLAQNEPGQDQADETQLAQAQFDEVQRNQAQDQADVAIREQTAQFVIEQPQPEISVYQPAPRITIEIPQPQIIVRMQEPRIRFEGTGEGASPAQEAQPQVEYRMEDPEIEVIRGEGQPEIQIERQSAANQQATGQVQQQQPQQNPARQDEQQPDADGEMRSFALDELEGLAVLDANGEEVGDVGRVAIDQTGKFYAIVSAGGFFGFGEEEVPIPLDRLTLRGDSLILATLTEEEIAAMDQADWGNYRDPNPQARPQIETEE